MNPTESKFINKQSKSKKIIYRYLTKILLSIIFLLGSIIFIRSSDKSVLLYNKYILSNSLSFTKLNELYNKYLGNTLLFKNNVATEPVFSEKLTYNEVSEYYDGVKLGLSSSMVPIISSGIVVNIGDKDNYGKTIIIQGVDGYDIWYGNIDNSSITLYDYVESKSLLGEVKDNTLYIAILKDGKHISFEEYFKQI